MTNEVIEVKLSNWKHREYLKEADVERLLDKRERREKTRHMYYIRLALERVGLL